LTAYTLGLEEARKERFSFIVEGETDLWTLRFTSFHGIGVPGADATRSILPEHVKGLDLLYVVREPDAGGDTLMRRVRARLDEIGWKGRALAISMPEGIKDLSALYLHCHRDANGPYGDIGMFLGQLDKAIVAGLPLEVDVVPEPAAAPAGKQYHLTSLGNSERLVDTFKDDLAHVHELGWLVWSGARWRMDPGAYLVQRMAKRVVQALHEEAQRRMDEAEDKEAMVEAVRLMRFAMACESFAKLEEMAKLAREVLYREPQEFDAHAMLFNVQNGTIDLTTGAMRPHDRADLITQLSPVTYDPKATAPTWERFIAEIMLGRPDLIAFLQRLVGYALTGDVAEEIFVVLYGGGSNGKTKFLETLRGLLGPDYARQCPVGTLLQKRDSAGGGSPSPDVARLRGARLATAVEPEKGRSLAEGVIKGMTGGDTQTARYLFRDFFEFRATFKLMLATNHKPKVPGGTLGMWRRIKLVPFEATFQGGNRDNQMGQKLLGELPGILNWAIAGTREWLARGLDEPAEVRQATEEYRQEEEVLGDFWSESCTFGPKLQVLSRALIEAYQRWCVTNGEKPLSTTAFGKLLTERGIKKDIVWDPVNKKSIQIYYGVDLSGPSSLSGLSGSEGMPGMDAKVDPDDAQNDLEPDC
jgi:P4 family phage/plasmid primase-like protien